MSAPETTAIVEPSLRRAAAIEEADRTLIRHGLPSYSRLAADAALHAVDFRSALAVRGLRIMRCAFVDRELDLREALINACEENAQVVNKLAAGDIDGAIDHLVDVGKTALAKAGAPPERLQPGVIDFVARFEARHFRDLTGGGL